MAALRVFAELREHCPLAGIVINRSAIDGEIDRIGFDKLMPANTSAAAGCHCFFSGSKSQIDNRVDDTIQIRHRALPLHQRPR